MTRVIRIDDDVYEHLKKLADPFEDTPNSVIRRILYIYESLKKLPDQFDTSTVRKLLYQNLTPNRTENERSKPSEKIKKGLLTPQIIYQDWLLFTLWDEFKGRAKKTEITEATILNMQRYGLLTESDFGKVSTGETRASNTIAWARNRLKDEGLISLDSPVGYWELTEKGIQQAKRMDIKKMRERKGLQTVQDPTSPEIRSTPGSEIRLQLKRSNAIGIERQGSKKFTVLKGAIVREPRGSIYKPYLRKRQEMESRGLFLKTATGVELVKDYEFDSKAQATIILLGVSESAPRAWKKI